MTLNQLSNGRFIVGLGASGPQVVEDGVAMGAITRTKEYISIMKKVFAREAPVEHNGFHYSLPYSGDDGTGLGKPLKASCRQTKIFQFTRPQSRRMASREREVADVYFLFGWIQLSPSLLPYRKRASEVGANDDGL